MKKLYKTRNKSLMLFQVIVDHIYQCCLYKGENVNEFIVTMFRCDRKVTLTTITNFVPLFQVTVSRHITYTLYVEHVLIPLNLGLEFSVQCDVSVCLSG